MDENNDGTLTEEEFLKGCLQVRNTETSLHCIMLLLFRAAIFRIGIRLGRSVDDNSTIKSLGWRAEQDAGAKRLRLTLLPSDYQ